jgi:RNA polymerase sigma-70 factor (ECF subfamily)
MLTDTHFASNSFARLLTSSQAQLYAFVFAQIADAHEAHDVFQETNRVLWEQADQFDAKRDFLPWAFAIARNQVRAARQRTRRDRLAFDDDTVQRIADRMSERAENLDDRQIALASCLSRLPPNQRELLERRYARDESVREIASAGSDSENSIAVTLFRVRRVLADCIRNTLTKGAKA